MLSNTRESELLASALASAAEAAAIAAAATCGLGDEMAADVAANEAMAALLSQLPVRGRIVVGDGLSGETHILSPGNALGQGEAELIDLAIAPIEGSTLVAKAMPNAISVIAAGPRGSLLAAPDMYMEKIAVGPGLEGAGIDLDAPAGENAVRVARAKGVDVSEITACVLDRPRHDRIIADLRRAGARVSLIADGDVAAILATAMPDARVDLYIGSGGAPQGVLAAAALKCVGGQMFARLSIRTDADRRIAREAGFTRVGEVFSLDDLVSKDAVFAAAGVTDGTLLQGVVREEGHIQTETLLMCSCNRIIRRIRTRFPAAAPHRGAGG